MKIADCTSWILDVSAPAGRRVSNSFIKFINQPVRPGLLLLLACVCISGHAQTSEWTWMGGSQTTQPGVYGTLGTPAAGNMLGSRVYASNWIDLSGNFWLFGGTGYDVNGNSGFLNDLWEFNPSLNQWTWVSGSDTTFQPGVYGTLGEPASGNTPGNRILAMSWTDSGGNLWLFGGSGTNSGTQETILNDLWEFNPLTKEWAWMSGSSTPGSLGVYGTPGTPAPENAPRSRYSGSTWTDGSGNLWLFGGYFVGMSANGSLNDVWEFSPSTNEWAWMGGSATTNSPGVHGTLGTPAAGNVPGSRFAALSWTDANGNFWLFGGDGPLNDLWEFFPSTNEWAWMGGGNGDGPPQLGIYGTLGIPSAANVPGARVSAQGWTDSSGNLWLFGGVNSDNGYPDDLWAFIPSTNEWAWMGGSNAEPCLCRFLGVYGTLGIPSAANTPGSRFGASTWTDASGHLWLFGGDQGEPLNDLWKYQPSPTIPPGVPPFGNLDQAVDSSTLSTTVGEADSLLVYGWAADKVDGAPLSNVKVYIDGTLAGTPTLGIARSDVAAAFSNTAYTNSGYRLLYPVSTLSLGAHAVTAVAIDSGGNSTTFGPLTFTVAASAGASPPFGNLDQAVGYTSRSSTVAQADSVFVTGWAADQVDGAPLSNVKVYIDGMFAGTPNLGIARPDVVAAYSNPSFTDSGYTFIYRASTLSVGVHAVTVVAIDSAGNSTTFGPRIITVVFSPPPFGNLDHAADNTTFSSTVGQADSVLVYGWVADKMDGAPLSNVMVYIDGGPAGTPALGIARPDVALAYTDAAYTDSGYRLLYPASQLSLGTHAVTVVATDMEGLSSTFGPLTITIAASAGAAPPFGNLDAAVDNTTSSTTVGQTDSLLVWGWAADQADGAPLGNVKVYIDGTLAGVPTLGIARSDVAAAFDNAAYTDSGYDFTYLASTLSLGSHAVTAVATDSGGRSTTFGPLTITVVSSTGDTQGRKVHTPLKHDGTTVPGPAGAGAESGLQSQ